MFYLFSAFVYLVCIVLSIPSVVLSVECLLALFPAAKRTPAGSGRAAILIPAHNEAGTIEHTLPNVIGEAQGQHEVVVVADNCTDETAQIARTFGVMVVERFDAQNRGKGFALAAGVALLKERFEDSTPPDVVVVLDADCRLRTGSLQTLVDSAVEQNRPSQSIYLMKAPEQADPMQRISAFAFLTKNMVRLRGLDRLGLSVPLTGSGMAFPWSMIEVLAEGSSEIVEDLELGLRLVCKGQGPRLCNNAFVDSFFPDSKQSASDQRTRWEHGYLSQMLAKSPVLLAQGIRGNLGAWGTLLDLLVPPLSLLVALTAMGALLGLAYYVVGFDVIPLGVLLIASGLAAVSIFLAWVRFGRETVSFSNLFSIPGYAFGKLSIYRRFVAGREKDWKRTTRN